MESDFFASFHPEANVMDKPSCSTYFHAVLDEEIRVLILVYLHEIETILESHIPCIVDIISKHLVGLPIQL